MCSQIAPILPPRMGKFPHHYMKNASNVKHLNNLPLLVFWKQPKYYRLRRSCPCVILIFVLSAKNSILFWNRYEEMPSYFKHIINLLDTEHGIFYVLQNLKGNNHIVFLIRMKLFKGGIENVDNISPLPRLPSRFTCALESLGIRLYPIYPYTRTGRVIRVATFLCYSDGQSCIINSYIQEIITQNTPGPKVVYLLPHPSKPRGSKIPL